MTVPIPADMPIRPAFWNVPLWGEIGVYLAAVVTIAVCGWGVWKNIERWRGLRGDALPQDPDRTSRLIREAVLQEKVRRTPAGRMHAVLVAGFFLLFLGTAAATLDWDVGHYVFGEQFLKGNVYLAYKLILDAAGVAVLVALAFGVRRRWFTKNDLPRDGRFAVAYGSLAFIVVTGYLIEAMRLAVQQPAWMDFSPVGAALARLLLLCGATTAGLEGAHIWMWTIHGLAALAFIAAVPATYYAHVYRVPVSIAVRRPGPAGALEKIEDLEEREHFGISSEDDFTPAVRAQLDACTECGRCNDVCPAVRAGTPLAPRTVVLKLRDRLHSDRVIAEKDAPALVDGLITRDELFSCTTCGACVRACPADIPTPDLIVGMRRHLALEQGEFPEGAAEALENAASVGNPWGLDPYERMDWARDLDVPVAEEGVEYDVLYWVGCAASYDRRARRIARAMVRILRAAGVSFAVMAEERCHAEFARRLGEEYLYQTAAQENIENLSRYRFRRMLTACPHCFNTLRNEYPAFEGGDFRVIDHASFIRELLTTGRLPQAASDAARSVAWHDPCYLARQNGVSEAPRLVLERLGLRVSAPAASCADTFCCGAGGGQMWTDQKTAKKRINVIRLESLRDVGAQGIATACPHCLTMLESAKPAVEGGDALEIRDLAEIVADALPGEADA